MYESLRSAPETMGSTAAEERTLILSTADASINTSMAALSVSAPDDKDAAVERGSLIPRWDSDFWRTYGNKLRVYGTIEEVCDLTARRQQSRREADTLSENEETDDENAVSAIGGRKPSILGELGKTIRSFIGS